MSFCEFCDIDSLHVWMVLWEVNNCIWIAVKKLGHVTADSSILIVKLLLAVGRGLVSVSEQEFPSTRNVLVSNTLPRFLSMCECSVL